MDIYTCQSTTSPARVMFVPLPHSHTFEERTVESGTPIKIGRAVARFKPSVNNAIFDCKVLSRNHALLWFDNGRVCLTLCLVCLSVCPSFLSFLPLVCRVHFTTSRK